MTSTFFDPDVVNFILGEILPNYISTDPEPFVHFDYDGERYCLNPPLLEQTGHFLACLKYLQLFSNILGFYVRPWKLPVFYPTAIFDVGQVSGHNVPVRESRPKHQWFSGSYLETPGPNNLLVVFEEVERRNAVVRFFRDIKQAQVEHSVYRLDIEKYNPYAKTLTSYCTVLFPAVLDFSNINYLKRGMTEMSYQVNNVIRSHIKDKKTLLEYIYSDINKNFIDVNDTFNIDSQEFRIWLLMLSDHPDDKEKNAGVLLINRVLAFCKTPSKPQYGVKTYDEESGVHIVYWNKEGVMNLFQRFYFTEIKESYDDEGEQDIEDELELNGPPTKKRKRSSNNKKKKSRTVKISWFNVWHQSNQYRGEVNGVVFEPWSLNAPPLIEVYPSAKEYINFRKINEFRGWPVTKEECRRAYATAHGMRCVERFEDLMKRVFCGNNRTYWEFIFYWIAWILQKPGSKTQVAIIIRSQMGMGKGFIGKIFRKWFGEHYYFLSGGAVSQKFNSFLHRKKMIFMDEVKSCVGDPTVLNSLVTEPTMAVERKGIDQGNETNLCEFFGATNDPITLKVGDDTRRWLIIEAPTMEQSELLEWRRQMSQTYRDFFEHPEYKDDGVWALYFYFLEMNIAGFTPFLDIPKTEAVKKMIEASLHPVHAWWKYILEHRQLQMNMDPNAPIEISNWTWPELYKKLRLDQQWDNIYAYKAKMTEAEFREQLLRVADIQIAPMQPGVTQTQFKFHKWVVQEHKWYRVFPDVALLHNFKDPGDQDVFTRAIYDKIRTTTPIAGLNDYTDMEKNYIITRLTQKLTDKITLNPSVYSDQRKSSGLANKDIIEFIYFSCIPCFFRSWFSCVNGGTELS